jgi:Bacterial protein of unknown function (DUF945)
MDMSQTKRRILIGLATLALIVAAWIGAGLYAAREAAQRIAAFAARPAQETGLRLSGLAQANGLARSEGGFDVQWVNSCADTPIASRPILRVRYALSHLILPGSLMRVRWHIEAAPDLAADLARLLGPDVAIEGNGTVGFDGSLRSEMTLPGLALRLGDVLVSVSASRGTLELDSTASRGSWQIGQLSARGAGQALELGDIGFEFSQDDPTGTSGSASMAIGKLSTTEASARGLRHTLRVSTQGTHTDFVMTNRLDQASFGGQDLRDLALELSARALDHQSLVSLSRLSNESCGFQNLTEDEDRTLRGALRTLLGSGFSVGIAKVSARIGEGSIQGQWLVESGPSRLPQAPIALARMLQSSGELVVRGAAMSEEQKQLMVGLGLAEQNGDALQARFDYRDGALRANGKPLDSEGLREALAQADRFINGLLDTPLAQRRAATRAGQDAEPEPTSDQSPESRPARGE